MKLILKIRTEPETFDAEDQIMNLLNDDSLLSDLEHGIENILYKIVMPLDESNLRIVAKVKRPWIKGEDKS